MIVMPQVPDLEELEETVRRMEARYVAYDDAVTPRLMGVYRELHSRFSNDLSDPRDRALSRGAVLMMIRYLVDGEPDSSTATADRP